MSQFRLAMALCLAHCCVPDFAVAALRCSGGNQVVGGQHIATPYCQDELLATVARGYGVKISGAAIRANPNLKRSVCRLVGRDIRVQHHCIEGHSVGRRGSW